MNPIPNVVSTPKIAVSTQSFLLGCQLGKAIHGGFDKQEGKIMKAGCIVLEEELNTVYGQLQIIQGCCNIHVTGQVIDHGCQINLQLMSDICLVISL